MVARGSADVTVAKTEKDGLPQTVSKANTLGDWRTNGGEIIGIPQEKIFVNDDDDF